MAVGECFECGEPLEPCPFSDFLGHLQVPGLKYSGTGNKIMNCYTTKKKYCKLVILQNIKRK